MHKCPLQENALENPDDYFIEGPCSYTYSQFESYVRQIQDLLEDYQEGQVIAAATQNPPFFIALLIAAMREKLILFPINFRLPEDEINKKLNEINALNPFKDQVAFDPSFKASPKDPFFYSKDALITYLMTSGTSSAPKICMHTTYNHINSAKASNNFLRYEKDDAWLLSMPLFHVSGISLIFRTLLAKATLILPTKNQQSDLENFPITHLSCVNTQLQRLIASPHLLKKLKVILLGGGAPSSSLIEKAKELQLPLYQTYGLTELSSQVATSKKCETPLCPLEHCEVQIDKDGQILLRGDSLFSGYYSNQKIEPALNKEGWFETKDLGILKNEHLTVTGRADNLFISGGENIQPEEIEAKLQKYPGITEAIVVPKKHTEFGFSPIAFIKVEDSFNAAHLNEFLQSCLPKFKIPKRFLPLEYDSLKPCRKTLKQSLKD